MHPDAWNKHFVEHVNAGLDGLTINVSVGDTDFECVVASTDETRILGLSEHTELPEDGMIFIYDRDHSAKYQSRSMSMDVSIWFFDAEGSLVGHGWDDGIATADSPYRYVLEIERDAELSGRLSLNSLTPSLPE